MKLLSTNFSHLSEGEHEDKPDDILGGLIPIFTIERASRPQKRQACVKTDNPPEAVSRKINENTAELEKTGTKPSLQARTGNYTKACRIEEDKEKETSEDEHIIGNLASQLHPWITNEQNSAAVENNLDNGGPIGMKRNRTMAREAFRILVALNQH
ncbi:hypothetical protein NQZ68_017895 [Dissostichus eleginoides]|nr:hypothetical protein NQZ68_017895 [Dissostichus eleginoides]